MSGRHEMPKRSDPFTGAGGRVSPWCLPLRLLSRVPDDGGHDEAMTRISPDRRRAGCRAVPHRSPGA